MPKVHHETVYFAGRVQGVGFRYAALQVAKEFEVAGSAENLPDGRVHVEVEGRADQVTAYVTAVTERMHGYISKVQRSSSEREAQLEGFSIR